MEHLKSPERMDTYQDDTVSLYQCLENIMKREEMNAQNLEVFQRAKDVAGYLIQSTFSIDAMFQTYILNRRGQVELNNFMTEDSHSFRCNVRIKSPSPVDTFKIHHKKPQEMPPHRILVTLDEDLGKADRVYQKCIWEDCVDEDGILRPDYILKWFNRGIVTTCERVKLNGLREHLQRELECEYFETRVESRKDGTICLHITIGKDVKDPTNLTINFVPSLPLRELPKQIRLRAPFPDRAEYFERRDQFTGEILKGIKSVEAILCLEARIWLQCNMVGLDQNIGVTWSVGCSALEEKAFQSIESTMNQTSLEGIVLLIDHIKENHVMGLHPITRGLIQNAIFHVHRKNVEKLQRVDQWFLSVMELMANQLKDKNAPSFFLNSKNLLEDWDSTFVQWMGKELEKIIGRVRRKPSTLYDYIERNNRIPSAMTLQLDRRTTGHNPQDLIDLIKRIRTIEGKENDNPNKQLDDRDMIDDFDEGKDNDDSENEGDDKNDNKTMIEKSYLGDEKMAEMDDAEIFRNKETKPIVLEESKEKEIKNTIFVKNLNNKNSNQSCLTHIYC